MTNIVAWNSSEDNGLCSAMASGEDDPWATWIPRAWHAVADQDGHHPPPERPIAMGGPGHGRVLDEHAELLAWWGPFTHFVLFGLGWPNPTLGIDRWQKMKSPTADPILAVIARWWGPYLESFLNWSRSSYHFANSLNAINADLGGTGPDLAAAPIPGYQGVVAPDIDVRWFGPGEDEMHVTAHLTPLTIDPRANLELLKRRSMAGQPNRAVLFLDRYQGWYRQLSNLQLPDTEPGRGWRVDVIVEPLGWLGQFRLPRESNRWFRGQHKWHQLGI